MRSRFLMVEIALLKWKTEEEDEDAMFEEDYEISDDDEYVKEIKVIF